MKIRQFLINENKKAKAAEYRKRVIDGISTKTKAGSKKFNDIMFLINVWEKSGKIDISYDDNKSGNVVPYVNTRNKKTAIQGKSVWDAENIVPEIFV
jgi:hypothetical protein